MNNKATDQTRLHVLAAALVAAGFMSSVARADNQTCPSPKKEQMAHGYVMEEYPVTGDKKKDAAARAAAFAAGRKKADHDSHAATIHCPKANTGFQCNVADLTYPKPYNEQDQTEAGAHYAYVGWRVQGLCVLPREARAGGASSHATNTPMNSGGTGNAMGRLNTHTPEQKPISGGHPGSEKNPAPLTVPSGK